MDPNDRPARPADVPPRPGDAPGPVGGHGPTDRDGVRRMDSAALFAGAREIEIDHAGARYRLRHTALGKLILTK